VSPAAPRCEDACSGVRASIQLAKHTRSARVARAAVRAPLRELAYAADGLAAEGARQFRARSR